MNNYSPWMYIKDILINNRMEEGGVDGMGLNRNISKKLMDNKDNKLFIDIQNY